MEFYIATDVSELISQPRLQRNIVGGREILDFFQKKHCQRHNGPRLLSLKLELFLQIKRIQIPGSARLVFPVGGGMGGLRLFWKISQN